MRSAFSPQPVGQVIESKRRDVGRPAPLPKCRAQPRLVQTRVAIVPDLRKGRFQFSPSLGITLNYPDNIERHRENNHAHCGNCRGSPAAHAVIVHWEIRPGLPGAKCHSCCQNLFAMMILSLRSRLAEFTPFLQGKFPGTGILWVEFA